MKNKIAKTNHEIKDIKLLTNRIGNKAKSGEV
jgi:hypothetical protein